MKLVIPNAGEVQAADARLIKLAEFLGVQCERVRLARGFQQCAQYFEKAAQERNSCLVMNPYVIRDLMGGQFIQEDLVSSFVLRFPHVLVHALSPDPFVGRIVAAVSGGKLQAVLPVADASQSYQISSDSKDICGPFSGLSFGPINAANDRVLAVGTDDTTVRKLICIDGRPNVVTLRRNQTEILFLASDDVVDVNAEIDPMSGYFSRLVPHAMALRYIFGEECWHPCKSHASIIIDDPLLRRDYGYLNFESLLRLMEECNFHTAISFIPHNYRRNSAGTIRMFRENPHRLSICFHGNDHTEAEFATADAALLNRMIGIAEKRMETLTQLTGLRCDRVMVFPHDNYSVEALEVLKSRNFRAAISRPHPTEKTVPLRILDLAQPAVLRYGGIPIFTRNFIKDTQSQDIAFNLFFGKPILIGEHHDAFKNSGSLLALVQKINSIAPGISWSNLENVVDNSTLRRRRPDGTVEVRPYTSKVLIANDSASVRRYSIEWGHTAQSSPIEQLLRDGTLFTGVEFDERGVRVLAELPPGASHIFSLVYRNDHTLLGKPGFMWDLHTFLRRRLSEVRDNYLSKNQHLMSAAKALQRRLLK
jgi:hypothetical protein